MEIKRGDQVVYVRKPTQPMIVVCEPEPFNGAMVVTCKWLTGGKKKSYEYGLFALNALIKEGKAYEHGD